MQSFNLLDLLDVFLDNLSYYVNPCLDVSGNQTQQLKNQRGWVAFSNQDFSGYFRGFFRIIYTFSGVIFRVIYTFFRDDINL